MRIGLDLDGTLLDCRPRQTGLLAALCRACSLPADMNHYWELKRQGCSNRIALQRMGMDEERVGTLAALWEQAIEDLHWLRFDPLLPGTWETLQFWIEQGHTLHLLSARRNHANAWQQLRLLDLDCFASVDFVDPFAIDAKKSEMAKLRPNVYIGDTERDARCADAAGVPAVLVSSGLRGEAYLRQCGDWPVAGGLTDVRLPTSRKVNQ